jgi:hypothetical protein
MLALFQYFIDLALLRRAPQDLPASTALLLLLAALSVLIGGVNGAVPFGGLRAALGANLIDLALSMTVLFGLLQFRGHAPRWLQTASAFLGLGVLAGLLMLTVRPLAELMGIGSFAMLADILLAIWLHVALGNVLRHALDVSLPAGVLIVLAYTVLAVGIITRIFPPVVVGS